MINNKKEGGFYASKVRLFLNEYNGISLEDFCKAENVSFAKMCNSLGRPSYRKQPTRNVSSTLLKEEPEENILPAMELKPLLIDIDKPEDSSSTNQQTEKSAANVDYYFLNHVHLKTVGQTEISIAKCPIKVLVSLIKEMEAGR